MYTGVWMLLVVALGALGAEGQSMEDTVSKLQTTVSQLTRQLMLQQLYVEEAARSEGDSGIKQIRIRTDGSKPYFTETHTMKSVATIHDHPNHIRTCGMGEFVARLNGVEFRTRHNDYQLKMPSNTVDTYHATENIPYPGVPPEVLQHTTVEGQMEEMRQWFKAWQDQNPTVRDYRRYFKPNLCYLEGAWTTDVTIDEPFDSDRHHLEADSWFELQEKIRFMSYTGSKSHNENLAYLPTTIMDIQDGQPVFGQWNYRILCHPIRRDIKLAHFKPVDNLASRIARDKTFANYVNTRSARFSYDPNPSDEQFRWSPLDDLMHEIPGKDNYGAKLNDTSFGMEQVSFKDESKLLNVGFYHRWNMVMEKDAMGEQIVHRGFADRNLFVAETTQPRVTGVSIPYCKTRKDRKKGTCETISKKMSYAIPLEIVFTTPLQSWNPYNLQHKDSPKLSDTVREGGRTGGKTVDKAFNGTNDKLYYRTPADFFTSKKVNGGNADTTRGSVGVLDRNGVVRDTTSSGMRIFLPNIEGVGVVRLRYPIMPVVNEGDPTWKELEALRDVVMDMRQYLQYVKVPPPVLSGTTSASTVQPDQGQTETIPRRTTLYMSMGLSDTLGEHRHSITLKRWQVKALTLKNKTLRFVTSDDSNHSHDLLVDYDEANRQYRIVKCDGMDACPHGHSTILTPSTDYST